MARGRGAVNLVFKISADGKSFKELAAEADGLRRAVEGVAAGAGRLNASAVNFAAVSAGIDQAQSAAASLNSAVQDLVSAYSLQLEAETKLAAVMRQRFGATDAEIQSVKDLAAAQQRLGIVGDEAQLMGAQQLATFLRSREALEALIPAMNDLVAQQKGYGATAQDAVSVANLMGKALSGQTSALRRAGITFTEAQERAVKYGTEQERAAALAEIIRDNIGGMNEALAKTPVGRAKQLSNALGDMKEKAGQMVSGVSPYVALAAQATTALGGVAKLAAGVRSLSVAGRIWSAAGKAAAWATGLFGGSAATASVGVRALRAAIAGLMAATGVGLAMAALGWAIDAIAGKASEAASEMEVLRREQEAWRKSVSDVTEATGEIAAKAAARLDKLYAAAIDEAKGQRERAAAVKEMQQLYPEYFGQLGSELLDVSKLSQAYGALKDSILQASRARAAQGLLDKNMAERIAQEEKLRELQPKIGEAEARAIAARKRMNDFFRDHPFEEGRSVKSGVNKERAGYYDAWQAELQSLYALQAERQAIQDKIDAIDESAIDLEAMVREGAGKMKLLGARAPLGAAKPEKEERLSEREQAEALDVTEIVSRNIECLADYDRALSDLRLKRKYAGEADARAIQEEIEMMEWGRSVFEGELSDIVSEAQAYKPKDVSELNSMKELREAIAYWQGVQAEQSYAEAAATQKTIEPLQEKLKLYEDITREKEKAAKVDALAEIGRGWSGLKEAKGAVQGLAAALEGEGSVLDRVFAGVDALMGLYKGFCTVAETVNALSSAGAAAKTAEAGATSAASAAGAVEAAQSQACVAVEAEQVAANKVAAASFLELAAASTFAAHAYIPFAGTVIAAGYVATQQAVTAAAGIPKFAKGGIAYGPTVGVFGEYAGAASNPEVVAPLDRLKSLLGIDGMGGAYPEKVELEIRGDRLVAVLERRLRSERRCGRG